MKSRTASELISASIVFAAMACIWGSLAYVLVLLALGR
jgi:hypothetical protein